MSSNYAIIYRTLSKKKLFQKIASSQFLKTSFFVFVFLLLSKIVQFLKELVVAKEIGVTPMLDAYILALLFVTSLIVFVFQPFAFAFIPIFIRLRKYSQDKANMFFSKIVLIATILGIVGLGLQLCLVEQILPLLASSFSEQYINLTKIFFLQLSPFYFFTVLSSLFGAYLNALNKNILYTIYPAFPALFVLLGFLFIPIELPVYHLVYGFNIGSFVALCLLIWTCYRNGFYPCIIWRLDKATKICLQQWVPLIFASFLMAVNPIIDKNMAATLGAGSVSQLEYGSKLFSIFSAFSITGLTTILFPYFSEKVAQKDYKGILVFIKKTGSVLILPLFLISVLVFLYAEYLVQLVFERGAFTAEDTGVVADVMRFYIIGFPFLTFAIIGVRLVNSLQLNKLIVAFSLVNVSANIILNWWFIELYGLKGIALSTSLIALIDVFLVWSAAYWFIKKRMKNKYETQKSI